MESHHNGGSGRFDDVSKLPTVAMEADLFLRKTSYDLGMWLQSKIREGKSDL